MLPSSLQDRIEAIESNQRDTDAHAFQKAVERRARVSFSVAIAGCVSGDSYGKPWLAGGPNVSLHARNAGLESCSSS